MADEVILNAGRVLPALSPSPPGVVTPAIAPQIARSRSAPPALAPPDAAPPALAPPDVAPQQVVGIHNLRLVRQRIAAEKAKKREACSQRVEDEGGEAKRAE